ncbi:MAG: sugar transferase [Lachnospiraceae bacterium]|nr:sugar transferase [Lachnospiraceae bacterium]
MKNRDQYKRLTEFIEVAFIFAVFSVIYLIIWTTLYQYMAEIPLFRRGNWAIVASYPILLFVFGKVFGAFKMSSRRIDILFSHVATHIVVNILSYFIIVLATRVYVPVWPLAAMFIGEVVLTGIWIIVAKKINLILFPTRRMLLIHGDYSYKDIVFTINSKSERYMVKETISSDEDIEVIKQRISEYESILISDIPAQRRNDLVKYCYEIGKRVYMLPKLSDILIRSASDVHVGDTQIFLLKNYGLSAEQKFIKRAFDIVVSGLMIAVSSPVMLIIAILIHAEDKGPVFYRQERLTRDAKVFNIIKFRSMKVDAEKMGAQLSQKHDPRVTKVGKILRVSHLDELPQLFNVFKGDMSMVGPRPERPQIMKEYMENVPEFVYRLKVKGGITGYAQVYGKYNTTPYNKLRLDLIYIQNYSLWLDIKCFVSTIKVVFRKETSEGVEDSQITAIKK